MHVSYDLVNSYQGNIVMNSKWIIIFSQNNKKSAKKWAHEALIHK
jgi:hypothetical protein